MDDLISRQAAIDALRDKFKRTPTNAIRAMDAVKQLPSAEPTLRERALRLLVEWAEECGFGYDNFPEEYERYKDEIKGMNYIDGMIHIAERAIEDEK